MENATKAMLIAAGILIGLMILSLSIALYSEISSYVERSNETIELNAQREFNTQYLNYINYNENGKQFDLTIQDIVTVANLAYENNIEYGATVDKRGRQETLYVAVYLNGNPIEHIIHEKATELLTENLQTRNNI